MNRLGEGRRAFRWENIRGPRDGIAVVLATGFGSGLAPVAPGSFGTLVGLGIHLATARLPDPLRAAIWLVLFALGTWGAGQLDRMMNTNDNQNTVMDEVVGYGITAWTAGLAPVAVVAAFVVFRLFDILKPPPIRQIDAWSHQFGKGSWHWIGFGVMADDALAGAMGLAVMLVLQHSGWV